MRDVQTTPAPAPAGVFDGPKGRETITAPDERKKADRWAGVPTEDRWGHVAWCGIRARTAAEQGSREEAERSARLEAIRTHVREHDVAEWIEAQLADLDRCRASVS